MRNTTRIVVALCALAAIAVWHDPTWISGVWHPRAHLFELPPGIQTTPSIAYMLDDERWTVFALSGVGNTIRVVTNASRPMALPSPPEAEWHYAVEYQIVDDGGGVVKQGVYHHFTKLTRFVVADDTLHNGVPGGAGIRDAGPLQATVSGARVYGAYYTEAAFLPTDGRIMLVDLTRRSEGTEIRLRLAEKDVALADVAARVYMREKVSEYRLRFQWARIREVKRERMARGNVYPQDVLNGNEIENVLRNTWTPLGPSGVEGTDYIRRNIYVVEDIDAEEAEGPVIPPAGLFVSAQQRGVIPVPENGGRVRLAFLEVGDEAYPPPDAVQVRGYGSGLTERWTEQAPWAPGGVQWEETVTGGLLEVEICAATTPASLAQGVEEHAVAAVARAFLTAGGQEEYDITPEPMYLRAYVAGPDLPVDFPVNHVADQTSPFRVDVRALYTQTDEPVFVTATYELLDALGAVVESGRVRVDQPISVYDTVTGAVTKARATEPAKVYFALPSRVATLRISADGPVLASAYNRPPGQVQEIRVPEDYFAFDPQRRRMPAWFPLPAAESDRLLMENRAPLLTVQYRPPEEDPDILAGRYRWEDFQPAGSWSARRLLTRRDDTRPWRDEALPVTFLELTGATAVPAAFSAPTGLRIVSPSLIYLRDTEDPAPLTFRLDGQPLFEGRTVGTRGEISLPGVPEGSHELNVEAEEGTRFFINYTGPANTLGGTPGVYTKRWAIRFNRDPLVFPYQKQSEAEEVLGMEFYAPLGAREPTVLRTRIEGCEREGVGPFAGWTFLERRYTIRPPEADVEPVPVLDTRDEYVAPARRVFVVLGEDMPPGPYHVRVYLEKGPGGYVLFSRTTPGVFEERTLYVEEEVFAEGRP